VAVTFRFRTKRPDHLRVADMAAFADVDVAAFELQCRERLHAFDRLCGFFLEEQGHDFHQAAEADGDDDQQHHQADIFFDYFMRR
jgi:hypothetical protein